MTVALDPTSLKPSGQAQPERRLTDREQTMNSWDIRALTLRPHSLEILTTTEDARVIALEIPAGESLSDHQVHLLLLTPWPGRGHPGTMPDADKAQVRERAAERRTSP
jgi:hypothetical protein